jgi:hypothetical protein
MEQFFRALMLGLAVLPLTYTVLYHPSIVFVKSLFLARFDVDHISWKQFFEYGFNCFMCQSFWISLFCGIIIRTTPEIIMAAWGVALLIDMVIYPEDKVRNDQI